MVTLHTARTGSGIDAITRMKEEDAGWQQRQAGIAALSISQKESKVHGIPTAEKCCKGTALGLRA